MDNVMERLGRFFKKQSTLRVLDKVIKNEFALIAGVALFTLVLVMGWWDWVEPLVVLVVLPTAGATWYEHMRARHRRYSIEEVGEFVIVAVEVNNDTAAAIAAHFDGREADVRVSSKELFGDGFIRPEQCTEMAKTVLRKCAPYRNQTIYLVLAGPAGLCFQTGQLLAAHKFDVVPLSWARDHYQELPRLGIDDMGDIS